MPAPRPPVKAWPSLQPRVAFLHQAARIPAVTNGNVIPNSQASSRVAGMSWGAGLEVERGE